jgi:hypothetical protein
LKPRNFPRLRGFFFSVAESQMPFQVVELRLDAEDQVIDRRAILIPIPSASTRLTLSKSSPRDWTRRITRRSAIFGRLSPKTGKRGSNLSSKASNHVWIEATKKGDRYTATTGARRSK